MRAGFRLSNGLINSRSISLMNKVRPKFGELMLRRISTSPGEVCSFSEDEFIGYATIAKNPDEFERVKKIFSSHIMNSKKESEEILFNESVLQSKPGDIELERSDAYSNIILGSFSEDEGFEVKYSARGIAPALNQDPRELLTKSFYIPGGQISLLLARHHVHFEINAKNPNNSFARSLNKISKITKLDIEDVKEMSSLTTLFSLPIHASRINHAGFQTMIFSNKNHEIFFEETTLPLKKPENKMASSQTAMFFGDSELKGKSTDQHYHPGDRSLIIYTVDRKAGAKINFCGINENPDERPDLEVIHHFPENSISVLNFPEGAHHKFYGEFSCVSYHPRDGKNIIELLSKGELKKGFLESSTQFSKKDGNVDIWNPDLPKETERKQPSNSRGL